MEPPSIFEMQASLCQAMANPIRLEIVHLLRERTFSVSEIAQTLKRPQATISRHLSILRQAGVVIGQRQGQEMHYQLANPKIADVCNLMRQLLTEQAARQSDLVKSWEQQAPS